jgi:hypothetical protein
VIDDGNDDGEESSAVGLDWRCGRWMMAVAILAWELVGTRRKERRRGSKCQRVSSLTGGETDRHYNSAFLAPIDNRWAVALYWDV